MQNPELTDAAIAAWAREQAENMAAAVPHVNGATKDRTEVYAARYDRIAAAFSAKVVEDSDLGTLADRILAHLDAMNSPLIYAQRRALVVDLLERANP